MIPGIPSEGFRESMGSYRAIDALERKEAAFSNVHSSNEAGSVQTISEQVSLVACCFTKMSHEKNPGWLGYIGDYTMESRRGFFVAHIKAF